MSNKLTDKVAIVTGGARGIGGQIAMAFAGEGADVVIADMLDEAAAAPVMASIAMSGRRPLFVHTNVAEEQQVRAMVDTTIAEFGRVDILVNNAGTFSEHGCEELSVEEFDRVVGVNLRGSFMCSRFVIPGMLERKSGVIINVASQLGQIGGLDMAHYCASKAGIIGMTKGMAREVATRGVRVNAIAPGPIVTDMMAEESEEWAARKLSELPMARFGQPDEVAPTAVFLASEDSSYYVGQTLCPNGGDVML
jgi:3-oxoacyl-[acyl-carrier protein] reductase